MGVTFSWSPEPAPFRLLLRAIAAEGPSAWVVGGAPRDALLGRHKRLNDVDVVVAHSAIPIARRVADRLGWAFYALDEARDVARLVFSASGDPLICDIARMRGGSIEADLRLRDFTVNAVALELGIHPEHTLIDVTGGQADLRAGIIRRVGATTLADDPVRLLRAVRFSVELGFPIENATRDQMLRMPGSVTSASVERIRDELWKTLAGHSPALAIEELRLLGLLPYALPEVSATDLVSQSAPHVKDVYRHTLAAVEGAAALRDWLLGRPVAVQSSKLVPRLLTSAQAAFDTWLFYLRQQMSETVASGRSRAEWLVWHALFHDVGKPETRSVEKDAEGRDRIRFLGHEEAGEQKTRLRLETLRFGRMEVENGCAAVRNHMRPHHLHESFAGTEISRRARFRFFRDIGPRGSDHPLGVDVVLLALADFLAIDESVSEESWHSYQIHMAQLLAFAFSEKAEENVARKPLVDGWLLMRELGLQPGPTLGALLDEVQEAHAAGEITTTDEALALAARLVAKGKQV